MKTEIQLVLQVMDDIQSVIKNPGLAAHGLTDPPSN
jgi:hypothetical protein